MRDLLDGWLWMVFLVVVLPPGVFLAIRLFTQTAGHGVDRRQFLAHLESLRVAGKPLPGTAPDPRLAPTLEAFREMWKI